MLVIRPMDHPLLLAYPTPSKKQNPVKQIIVKLLITLVKNASYIPIAIADELVFLNDEIRHRVIENTFARFINGGGYVIRSACWTSLLCKDISN